MAAGVGAAGLPAAAAGAGAPDCLGGAGPVGAPGAWLPAGRGDQVVGAAAAAVGLLLREPALLQVGVLSPARTGEGAGRRACQLLRLRGCLRLPALRMRTGLVATHPHLPEPRPQSKPTSPTSPHLRCPQAPSRRSRFRHSYPTRLEAPAHLGWGSRWAPPESGHHCRSELPQRPGGSRWRRHPRAPSGYGSTPSPPAPPPSALALRAAPGQGRALSQAQRDVWTCPWGSIR